MSEVAEADFISESERLELVVDQAVAAHDGDMRLAIRTLILMQQELETKVSQGFIRGVWHGRFRCYSG